MAKAVKKTKDTTTPTEFKNPSGFTVPVIRNASTFDEHYQRTEALYNEAHEEFFAMDARDPRLPEAAAECEEAARDLIMAAAALFGRHTGEENENKEKALRALQKCKEDASARANSLELHYKLEKAKEDADPTELKKLRKRVSAGDRFYYRAYNTQQRYLKIHVNDPNYMTPELRLEKKYSRDAAYLMSQVPRGHIFLPARPFPPYRVPEGEPVPWIPEPYDAWKNVPVEDLVYDIEHDEFVLPEGYVSEDGRIDDKSVTWDWENNLVTMKFVDGPAITWPFWKPKNTSDVLKKGDWPAEYYIRLYQQILEAAEPPGFDD